MKRVCIHQPDFVPYLGFFDRLIDTDVFVVHDDVQFHKSRWHHRDKIKTARGPVWLTLPIVKPHFGQLILDTKLVSDRDSWMPKHIGMLRDAYRAAPYFDEFIGAIENIYRSAPRNLAGFNLAFLEFMFQILEIDCELVFSSRLGCTGDRNSRLAATVKAVGGTHYLSGTGALDYLEPQVFHAADIILEIQSFTHPTYTQLHGEFIPGLSCLDILFNCGRQSARILRAKCAF